MNPSYWVACMCYLIMQWYAIPTHAARILSDTTSLEYYSVGVDDTILYDLGMTYEQYGYKGPAPLFVHAVFPDGMAHQTMTYGQIKLNDVPPPLMATYDALWAKSDSFMFRDAFKYNLNTDTEIDYASMPPREVMQIAHQQTWTAHRASVKHAMGAPVIVYHHGSQGTATENLGLATYFAQRGYIVLMANHHWPYASTTYGLTPLAMLDHRHTQNSDVKTILSYARYLAQGNKVMYIGHSWGAQQGWCILEGPDMADAFVSLETTIEYKSDTNVIKDFWPTVYRAVHVEQKQMQIPVLHVASAYEGLNFDFFKNTGNQVVFAAYQSNFYHNSYLSVFTDRAQLLGQIPVPDLETLQEQYAGYVAHLTLMEAFFTQVIGGTPMEKQVFEPNFKFYSY